ncbi:hypothetical protein sphantq_02983 [Sphingobium sp. AntQ-1]|uniref:hypothetical protein n=1 Tax=Sphingobium sp. AntQ-1 TaxID=2930091 RepID=UPI00234F1A97|nr:hypothetical protein [Sphingobium sp. AntQ-1]WCP14537.1 hypothetical protein sphantq_02983 [Sphingobium sp. AntQ-1]
MSGVTARAVQAAAEKLRDELTEMGIGPRIFPMAFDVIASRSAICNRFAAIINEIKDTTHAD